MALYTGGHCTRFIDYLNIMRWLTAKSDYDTVQYKLVDVPFEKGNGQTGTVRKRFGKNISL